MFFCLATCRTAAMSRPMPLGLDLFRHVILDPHRGRAVTHGVLERIGVVECHLLHQRQRFLKFVFRFTGKSDDDVRRQRDAGHRGAQRGHDVEIPLAVVAAQHAP